ncbi:hypothetical protein PR202_ga25069 [Eleusine coracana subsp. coracana]|uniref:Uncharacterized protein n=1 Tax=Eleusine coracana subsp. coracana TaxID=191504 RepID=A0AAV5DAE2_ELECO|nr:hypothetical protein PR202_ga25069 [Eleusine coracana subsp. coracana]
MASRPPTTLKLVVTATMFFALLLVGSSVVAQPPRAQSAMEEEDKVHDFLRVMDRAARYRRDCFGECAKSCYCADNPYSCLRDCMPTPPVGRCGATYDSVQGVFSSSASFSFRPEREDGMAGSGEELINSRPT